ncbi:MAG: cold shock and DUF1294 domain-containing protein [Lysobacterales bacterium]
MRSKGKITHWNDDKAYGFIQPGAGGEKVFVHIRAFDRHIERPDIDEKVSYSLSTDKQGRPCAVKVKRAGEKSPRKKHNNNYSGQVLIALAFLSVVGLSVMILDIPKQVLFVYLVVSLITFIVYAVDKSAARRDAWRTKENTLHLLALFGGWPGALIAQQTLRHKSSKRSFRAVFWVTVVLNCGVYVWLLTPDGSAMLHALIDEVALVVWDSGNR